MRNVGPDEPVTVREMFYDAVVTLEYRTTLNASRFIFTRALDLDQFNARIKQRDYLFTWRLEETADLPRDSSQALDLHRLAIDNVELPQTARTTVDGAYEIVCEDPVLEAKFGTEVTVHYTVVTKLRRHDHVFFYAATRPTHGVTVVFDYADTDIESVLTYDFFVSAGAPVMHELPHNRTVVVELDEWVFPKSGVSFVWRLKGEHPAGEVAR